MKWHERPFASAELPDPSALERVELYECCGCIFIFLLLSLFSYGEPTACLAVSVHLVWDLEMVVQGLWLLYGV